MAVEIKSGDSSDLGTVDPISKALRVTTYNSDGVEGTREMPVVITCSPVTLTGNDIISSLDVSQYKTISLQLTGTWVGTVTFQGSNDNGTFYDIVAQNTSSTVLPYSVSTNVLGLFSIPVIYKYFRAKATVVTSGTITGSAYGHKEDKNLNSVGQIGIVTLAAETTKVIGTVNVAPSQSSISGTITAADTAVAAPVDDGSLRTGTPSVGSTVVLDAVAQDSSWAVEITGTLGGATFYFEGTTSSTNGVDGSWTLISGRQTKSATSLSTSTTIAGVFRGNLSGMDYFRVRAVGGVAITATIKIRIGQGSGAVFLNAALPEGNNSIGKVSITTNTALQTLYVVGQSGLVGVNSASATSTPTTLRALAFTNYTAGARHFKVYNTASVPVAGVGVPFIVVSLPATGTFSFPIPMEGLYFSNGLGYTMTTGAANNDVTPTATAGDFTVNLIYAV